MILEIIKIAILLSICTLAAWTDISHGIISNRLLLTGAIAGLFLNVLTWTITSGTYIIVQLINIVVLCVIAVLLYALHIWAGGDCKLLMTVSLLVPSCVYSPFLNPCLSLILLPAFAFLFSYLFLLADSIIQTFSQKSVFSKEMLRSKLFSTLIRYCANVVYITLFDQVLYSVCGTSIQQFLFLINSCVILGISNIAILQKRHLILIALVLSAVIKIVNGQTIATMFDVINFGLVLIVLSLRIFIDSYNYAILPTNQVQSGMILSAATTLLFMKSNVKGLPQISTEDLRARLTPEEADSVRRWEHSKYGQPTVQIVRKIPFAIFIALGTLSYLILGVAFS